MKKTNIKIFEVNNFTVSAIEIGNALNRLVIVEDFFKYPDLVREYALNCNYFEMPHTKNPGVVSRMAVDLPEVREAVDFIKKNTFSDHARRDDLTVMTFQAYRTNNNNAPHYDFFQYAGICSLNTYEENPDISGTSFYRYKDGHEYATTSMYRGEKCKDNIHEDWTKYHTETHEFNKFIFYEGYLYHNLEWDEGAWKSEIPRLTFNFFGAEDVYY